MQFIFFVKVLKCVSERGNHKAVFNSNTWNVWQTFNISVSQVFHLFVPDFLLFVQHQL